MNFPGEPTALGTAINLAKREAKGACSTLAFAHGLLGTKQADYVTQWADNILADLDEARRYVVRAQELAQEQAA